MSNPEFLLVISILYRINTTTTINQLESLCGYELVGRIDYESAFTKSHSAVKIAGI